MLFHFAIAGAMAMVFSMLGFMINRRGAKKRPLSGWVIWPLNALVVLAAFVGLSAVNEIIAVKMANPMPYAIFVTIIFDQVLRIKPKQSST